MLQNETEVNFGQGPRQPRPGWLYYVVGPSYVFHDDDDDNDRNRKNTCFMREGHPAQTAPLSVSRTAGCVQPLVQTPAVSTGDTVTAPAARVT